MALKEKYPSLVARLKREIDIAQGERLSYDTVEKMFISLHKDEVDALIKELEQDGDIVVTTYQDKKYIGLQ